MPIYPSICTNSECKAKRDILSPVPDFSVRCEKCESPMRRDWGSSNVISTFHPTRDLYAQKKNGKR